MILLRLLVLLCSCCSFSFSNENCLSIIRCESTPNKDVGRICINDRNQEINESTFLYVKAALEYYKESKPAYVILELDTPGGELYAAKRISNELLNFSAETKIPVVAYINNWAISAGALLAYSCQYIIITPNACMGAATPVSIEENTMKEAPEKVNSLVRAEFANKATFFNRNPDIARAMVDSDDVLVQRNGKIILVSPSEVSTTTDEVLLPHGKLLTLTSDDMIKFGVADYLMKKPLSQYVDEALCRVHTYKMTTKEQIISFLASPAVSSALVFIAIICFYIEMSAPGASVPGLIAGIAFFLVIVGSFAQDAITLFEPLCLLGGVLLILAEMFIFPTFGILLLIGGMLCLFGLLGFLIPGLREITFSQESLPLFGGYILNRLGWLSGAFLLALLSIIFLARFVSAKLLTCSGIILQKTMPTLPTEKPEIHVGDRPIVTSTLRPSGKIMWKNTSFDAVSRGSFIEKGETVRVTEIRGNVIVVEP